MKNGKITSKEDVLNTLQILDMARVYKHASENDVRMTSLRIPPASIVQPGLLVRKVLRKLASNAFPTCDIKLLSRGIRVEMDGAIRRSLKFLYNRSLSPDDAIMRTEMLRIPEVSALINSINATVRHGNGLEVCYMGSYVVFRAYENDLNAWSRRYGTVTPLFDMYKEVFNRIKSLREGLEAMNCFLAKADELILEQKRAEEAAVAARAEEMRANAMSFFDRLGVV